MILNRASTIYYGHHEMPHVQYKDEAKALMESCRAGYGQLFMHIESGAIIIFWPMSFDSTWSAREAVRHSIRYELVGEHSPRAFYAAMRGNPMVYGFEWLGEYTHMQDPYQ